MLEKLLTGPKTYYLWLLFLLAVIAGCGLVYLQQLQEGLSITGMSRDVSWGLYISQFTYLVGVAASAVMLVLPAYFHHYKKFKRMIIFGEFMAISAVVMCALFIVVDLGQPQRMMNVLLHPTPNSVMFYDMIVLIGYLTLNAIIGWVTLEAARNDVKPPKWIKPLIYLSILWAFSIHTVTAFLYAGIPGRHYWLTAIMAARFLSSAFCSGPAILLLLIFIVRRLTGFDPGRDAVKTLTTIITPTEVMDGAIVSGNCVSSCDKNPTYVHMNNPVVTDLFEQHGKTLNFVGMIITNENVYLADKERSSNWSAKLAKYLGCDGVIISQEGFGNPDTDLIMNTKKIEAEGIKTVIITDEYAGRDGKSQSLADADPSADAVVTGGNANQVIVLPPMETVYGHLEFVDTIAGGSANNIDAHGNITVEIQAITGATNETGFNYLSAR